MAKHMQTAADAPDASQVKLFFWERPGMDFPFYNDESMKLWQPLLLIGSAIAALLSLPFLPEARIVKTAVLFLVPFVPFLIVARGNIFTIIKRPRFGDIPLIIVTLILTIGFGIFTAAALYNMGYQIQGNSGFKEVRDSQFFAMLFFQLFGEEMIKVNTFLGVMTLVFGRTRNRGLSIALAIVVTLFVFGIGHMRSYNGAVLQILLIQGLGSIFSLFCYMRTKNVLTSFAMHVLQDFMFFA